MDSSVSARVRRAFLGSRNEAATEQAEQQVTRPAERAVDLELRAGLGMQGGESGPNDNVQKEKDE